MGPNRARCLETPRWWYVRSRDVTVEAKIHTQIQQADDIRNDRADQAVKLHSTSKGEKSEQVRAQPATMFVSL